MTKVEDLPLKFDPTVSFTVTAPLGKWEEREQLAVDNHGAAVHLAYLTIGHGNFSIDLATMTYEFVTIDPEEFGNFFGIKYTWNVVPTQRGA